MYYTFHLGALYDFANGWRVYAPNVPPYVVTLNTLDFGRGYWISVTQPITWLLKGASPSAGRGDEVSNLQLPPTTFYGAVQTGNGFTPTVGMSVIARVNNVVCGQGQTQSYQGQIVYSVQVWAEGNGTTGCGVTGRTITFQVGGRNMATTQTTLWDDSQVWNVPLSPAPQSVYLPLVMR